MSEFFQEPTVVTIQGKEITISPLKVRHLSLAIKFATPLIQTLKEGNADLPLLLAHTDEVVAICALASNTDIEWVGDLNTSELLMLLGAVVVCNSDFFTQSTLPQIQALMGSIGKIAESVTKTTTTS